MGWEKRGGQRYFYRTERRGGRYVKVYLGRGAAARDAARQEEATRRENQLLREAVDQLRAAIASAETDIAPVEQSFDAEVAAALNGLGYRFHRGSWRKRRGSMRMNRSRQAKLPSDHPEVVEETASGAQRGRSPDERIDAEGPCDKRLDSADAGQDGLTRRLLSDGIDCSALAVTSGQDKAAHRQRLAKRFDPGSLFSRVLQRYARLFTQNDREKLALVVNQAIKEFADLCPPGVSEIEIVAAERVAIARMKVQVFDLLSLTPEAWRDGSDLIEKRQELAGRELERAMRSFLTLRKAAASVPGFRVTLTERVDGDASGQTSQTRSITLESLPESRETFGGGESTT